MRRCASISLVAAALFYHRWPNRQATATSFRCAPYFRIQAASSFAIGRSFRGCTLFRRRPLSRLDVGRCPGFVQAAPSATLASGVHRIPRRNQCQHQSMIDRRFPIPAAKRRPMPHRLSPSTHQPSNLGTAIDADNICHVQELRDETACYDSAELLGQRAYKMAVGWRKCLFLGICNCTVLVRHPSFSVPELTWQHRAVAAREKKLAPRRHAFRGLRPITIL